VDHLTQSIVAPALHSGVGAFTDAMGPMFQQNAMFIAGQCDRLRDGATRAGEK
jgi:hypothetical protein